MKASPKTLPDLMALLMWEGQLKNQRVQQVLGVKQIYATQLIAALREENPRLLEYDLAEKTWLLKGVPHNVKAPDFSHYTRMAHHPAAPIEEIFGTSQKLLWPSAEVFRTIHLGIAQRRPVEIHYRSMSDPKGERRIIAPHSLVNIGPRTHVRAWCYKREDFRDFNLGRMTNPALKSADKQAPTAEDDAHWNEIISVVVRAHGSLSSLQQAMIRDEYFQGAAQMRLGCRGALIGYLINGMRISIDDDKQNPPDFLLTCGNISEIKPWLFS